MKVGILGGGQLGRMLALAGYPLGLTLRRRQRSEPQRRVAGEPTSHPRLARESPLP